MDAVVEAEKVEISKDAKFGVEEAKKLFAKEIQFVNARYTSSESTLTEKEQQEFIKHNDQVLTLSFKVADQYEKEAKTETGKPFAFTPLERRIIAAAAIFHDIGKGDKPQGNNRDKNFVLVNHHNIGSIEAEKYFVKNREALERLMGGNEFTSLEADRAIAKLQAAILSHMGPHPGFMTTMLGIINRQTGATIRHPFPEKDPIGQVLLTADMASLFSKEGVAKILTIHSEGEYFRAQDKKTSAGILPVSHVALLSALDSGDKAWNMIKNLPGASSVAHLRDEAQNATYHYKATTISPSIFEKWSGKNFNEVKRDIKHIIEANGKTGGLNALVERQVLEKYGIDLKGVNMNFLEDIAKSDSE